MIDWELSQRHCAKGSFRSRFDVKLKVFCINVRSHASFSACSRLARNTRLTWTQASLNKPSIGQDVLALPVTLPRSMGLLKTLGLDEAEIILSETMNIKVWPEELLRTPNSNFRYIPGILINETQQRCFQSKYT